MDSPKDLFEDSVPQMHAFAPAHSSTDLPGVHPQPGTGRPPPAFRPSGFPLMHHLLQPGGAARRVGGQLSANLSAHRNVEEDRGERDGQVEHGMERGGDGLLEGEDGLLGAKKRHGDAVLAGAWGQDILKVKRMKLEGRPRNAEAEEGGQKHEGGRKGKRREREELKEQLEEARERLQALQEKVWRAFGEMHMVEEEKKSRRSHRGRGEGQRQKDKEERMERGRGGGLHLEGGVDGAGLWLDNGCLERDDWHGVDDEGEAGGQNFAQALKVELGGAVARVIDRVLRLYTDMTDSTPSSPPAAISFLPRSPDIRKSHPLLGPPLSSHPNLSLHHPSLPRPPPLSHPPLLPPASQPKDPPSSSFHPPSSSSSSSSSSYPPPPPPPPPPPLPLPLLHYSMQQLFSRSLHHPQLPHLPPSRKDFLNSDPFLEFASHPPFPPLPLLGHLDPSLARHAHASRERERGMRGDGMRGGLDGGDLYLTEGLSPCHLKKAKLMFFYTRYPSSNTLKTYFPDVKFNRCVTSQMIKWFSNFREFFYIQMERFARQAVREALTRESQLRVGRDTELYRILNMHYNKSNVYQVPERFIEVSEVALREFYSAIWTGRDSDPCWKKGIYKIICKLDSPVPDTFRLPGCPSCDSTYREA
uniref:Prospero domain-containing protein n=1 Tax=Mola mola TaxID=94237 RepID=A0A3Q3X9E0_MOLML